MNCSAASRIACMVVFLGASVAQSPPRFEGAPPLGAKEATATQIGKTAKSRAIPLKTGDAPSENIARTSPPPVPEPARVTLQHGLLTVSAHDSDLSQILGEVAQSGGMKIDGSIHSVKVFGQYGPGNSREVLTDLLQGLGYNFVMVGETTQGAPKELLLTPRTGSATPPSQPTATNGPPPVLNSDGSIADENHPGPGAVVNVPPPPPDDVQERVQQHLQRLEQMHQPPQTSLQH